MIRSVGFCGRLQIIDERDDKILLLFVEGRQAAEGMESFGARILLNVKEFGWSQHEVIADVKEDGHGGHHTSVLDPIDVGRGETEGETHVAGGDTLLYAELGETFSEFFIGHRGILHRLIIA